MVDDTYYNDMSLLVGVQASALPWWRAAKAGGGFHALTVYGYYLSGGGGLYLIDPWNATWSGYKTPAASETYAAMSGNDYSMVW